MGVPSFYAWVKKRYPLMVEHVHHTCSDSPDGQAGADSFSQIDREIARPQPPRTHTDACNRPS